MAAGGPVRSRQKERPSGLDARPGNGSAAGRQGASRGSTTRRELLRKGLLYGAAFGLSTLAVRSLLDAANRRAPGPSAAPRAPVLLREARFSEPLADGMVRCALCPNRCTLAPGGRGLCRVRVNREGRLYTLAYGNPASVTTDVIEKAPLYHFKPGSTGLSLAIAGCNLHCLNCQNWELSQKGPDETENTLLSPLQAVENARALGATAIVFTYSDPSVSFEYVLDTFTAARASGLDTVMVTAGFINPEPLRELAPVLSAAKVDVKGFSERFYTEVCGARLQPVLDTCKELASAGVWLELVNLVIPTLSDDPADTLGLARWVRTELGPDVPLHYTRFYPDYRLTALPLTPMTTLARAREAALAEGLRFVYIGNVPGSDIADTACPSCGAVVVRREGLTIKSDLMTGPACPRCGAVVPGVWA